MTDLSVAVMIDPKGRLPQETCNLRANFVFAFGQRLEREEPADRSMADDNSLRYQYFNQSKARSAFAT